MFAILIIGLIAGPAVSLYGSPTVSPVIDALCASLMRRAPLTLKVGTLPRFVDRGMPLYLDAARSELDAAGGRSAELLQSQLDRFESLLVDLLEISRFDAGAATLDAELVDVCDLVRRSADDAQQLHGRPGDDRPHSFVVSADRVVAVCLRHASVFAAWRAAAAGLLSAGGARRYRVTASAGFSKPLRASPRSPNLARMMSLPGSVS